MRKIIAILLLALAVQGTAQAQLGGMLNKAKKAVTNKVENAIEDKTKSAEKKAEQTVKETTDEAKQTVTEKSNEAVTGAASENEEKPLFNEDSSERELYKAFNQIIEKLNAATDKKDIDEMTTYYYQLDECMDLIVKGNPFAIDEKNRQSDAYKKAHDVLFDGLPFQGMSTAAETKASMQWDMEKIKASNHMATQKFYVTDATSRRYMHYTFGKDAKLDPDIEAINNELMPYWDSFNEAFKTKYANSDPRLEFDAMKEYGDNIHKRVAENKAKLEAQRVENSKYIPKAAVNDPALEAEIKNWAKGRWENRDLVKVILTDKEWGYDTNAFGVILRRGKNFTVILRDKSDKTYYMSRCTLTQQANGSSYGKNLFSVDSFLDNFEGTPINWNE